MEKEAIDTKPSFVARRRYPMQIFSNSECQYRAKCVNQPPARPPSFSSRKMLQSQNKIYEIEEHDDKSVQKELFQLAASKTNLERDTYQRREGALSQKAAPPVPRLLAAHGLDTHRAHHDLHPADAIGALDGLEPQPPVAALDDPLVLLVVGVARPAPHPVALVCGLVLVLTAFFVVIVRVVFVGGPLLLLLELLLPPPHADPALRVARDLDGVTVAFDPCVALPPHAYAALADAAVGWAHGLCCDATARLHHHEA
jgi:hypothetical protein